MASRLLRRRRANRLGFTLVELLVVIVAIGLLAAMLLPALSRASEHARRITCLNNSRQITTAMLNYLGDNRDTFPAANFSPVLVPEDWIYYDGVDPTMNSLTFGGNENAVKNSPIVRYTARFDTNLFRCPTDRFLKELDENPALLDPELVREQRYVFNYSLNAGGANGQGAPFGQGMASTIFPGISPICFHASSISQPSMKIMIAEKKTGAEGSKDEMSDCGWSSGWNWSGLWWDISGPPKPWVNIYPNKLTARHRSKGNQSFADGHTETLDPNAGLVPEHCDPTK